MDSTRGGQDISRAQFLCHWVFTTRLPKSFPFSWEYLELLQTSCPEKQGVGSWKPILENLTQEIHQGYTISLWSDLLEDSPGPASHLGGEMVRAHPPFLLASRPMLFTVGREEGVDLQMLFSEG